MRVCWRIYNADVRIVIPVMYMNTIISFKKICTFFTYIFHFFTYIFLSMWLKKSSDILYRVDCYVVTGS
jgi:hypothetical protein